MDARAWLALAALAAASIYGGGYAVKSANNRDLRHFEPWEFGIWWPLMSDRLLRVLDEFRAQWGAPVRVSPVAGGIGRRIASDEPGHDSQHNVTRWGEVRAVDVFPHGMDSRAAVERARRIAQRVGATGIGVYPEARPSPMLHIDVRTTATTDDPATWGALRADGGGWTYTGTDYALERATWA